MKNKIIEEQTSLNANISKLLNESGILLLDEIALGSIDTKFKIDTEKFELNNIQMNIYKEKIKKVENEITYFKKSLMPVFEVFYNNEFYNNNENHFDVSVNDLSREYTVGFKISFDFKRFFEFKHEKEKKRLQLIENKNLYDKYKKDFKRDFDSKYVFVRDFDEYKKNKLLEIDAIKKEKSMNERLYEQGIDYKYKIIESEIKLLNLYYLLKTKEIDNNKNRKYLSIKLEREKICTPH
jgi:hypothetical protein